MKKMLFCSAVMGLLWGTPAWAQTDAEPLPNWRLEVLTYGGGSSCGLYRRLGPTLDLGLNVGGQIAQRKDDTTNRTLRSSPEYPSYLTTNTGTIETHQTSIHGGPELRRWAVRTDRLSVYYGATATASYGRVKRNSVEPESTDGTNRETHADNLDRSLSLGLGATFGASLHLTDHLAALMSLSPVSFSYGWRQADSHYYSELVYATNPARVVTDERFNTQKGSGPSLQFAVSPGLFVTLDF